MASLNNKLHCGPKKQVEIVSCAAISTNYKAYPQTGLLLLSQAIDKIPAKNIVIVICPLLTLIQNFLDVWVTFEKMYVTNVLGYTFIYVMHLILFFINLLDCLLIPAISANSSQRAIAA